jgi:arylsulfatase A-like enzyme
MRRNIRRLWPVVVGSIAVAGIIAARRYEASKTITIVIGVEGLRPDIISRPVTPNLARIRDQGVNFTHSHSVFPTVSRVNGVAITTGMSPSRSGIISNSIYIPSIDSAQPLNTADAAQLQRLTSVNNGKLLLVRSLGERLQKAGKRIAVVSAGSSGLSLLLNPTVQQGTGVTIAGAFEGGKRAAYPDSVNNVVLRRFGLSPQATDSLIREEHDFTPLVDWAQRVLYDYVLPTLKPDVIIDWMAEPEESQSSFHIGSTRATNALDNTDRHVGLLLKLLDTLGYRGKANIIVVSDHGFAVERETVNFVDELVRARLKESPTSNDVVVSSNGQSVLINVRGRDPERIAAIVQFLQGPRWTGAIFARDVKIPLPGKGKKKKMGSIPGALPLEVLRMANDKHGPDIVVTFPWSDELNSYAIPGMHERVRVNGPFNPNYTSGHGGLSPWVVHNTMFAWGPAFKKGVKINTPVSNADVTPTILAMLGLDVEGMDGRPLREAFRDARKDDAKPKTRTITAKTDTYEAAVEITEYKGARYIEKAWRIK